MTRKSYINIYICLCIVTAVYPTSGKIDFFPPPLFPRRRRRRRFMRIQYPNAISLSNDKTTGKIIFTSRRRLYDFFAHIKRKHASKYDFAPYITHTGRLYIYIYKYRGWVYSGSRVCARSPYLQQQLVSVDAFYFYPTHPLNHHPFHCPRDKRKCELSRVNAGNARSAGRQDIELHAGVLLLPLHSSIPVRCIRKRENGSDILLSYVCAARAPDRYFTIILQVYTILCT